MQTIKRSDFALLALLCFCLLGACGYKGPLYLPDEQPTVTPATDQDAKTEKAENDTDGHK